MNKNTVVITSRETFPAGGAPLFSDGRVHVHSTVGERFNLDYERRGRGFVITVGDRVNARVGVRVEYDGDAARLRLHTDAFGTEVLYHRIEADGFLVSNRLEPFADTSPGADLPSIYQYLVGGYCVGPTTFLRGVEQTLCAQRISIERDGTRWRSTAAVEPWGPEDPGARSPYELVPELSTELEGTVLMASAGWDSRTLLCNADPRRVVAYTHGDLSSREIEITRRITGDLRIDHLFADTRNDEIDNALLDRMLDELGCALFPSWFVAARKIQRLWDRPLSSGVLGEFLGGHWGVDMLLGTRTRASSILKFAPGYRSRTTFDEIFRRMAPSTDLWYLNRESRDAILGTADELVERARSEMLGYGLDDVDLTVEQFMVKHRGRQYQLRQAHCAKSSVGYVIPFADERLVGSVLSIPHRKRMHNSIHRRLLEARGGALLKYPMAATLCAARRPIAVQELSRGLRLAIEKTTGRRNFGWFNYDFLLGSSFFDDAIDSLELPLWDREAMRRNVGSMKRAGDVTELGYTLDTVCKLRTLDRALAGATFA